MKKVKRHNQAGILSYAVLLFFSLIVLYPLAWMVLTSLKLWKKPLSFLRYGCQNPLHYRHIQTFL